MIAVRAKPVIRNIIRGYLLNADRSITNRDDSIPFLIMLRPMNKSPVPNNNLLQFCSMLFFPLSNIDNPAMPANGYAIFSIFILKPTVAIIQLLKVVPRFEPSIKPGCWTPSRSCLVWQYST